MKNKVLIVFIIVLLSIISVGLIFFMIGMINGKTKFKNLFNFGYRVSDELVLDETYSNNFNEIKIESDASEIYINYANDDIIRVVIYGNKDKMEVKTEDNNLFINSKNKKCIGLCFNLKISKIEVYLPKEFDKDINISNNYGDVKISEFLNANINIEEDCGDIFINGGNNINVKNSYGDIKIEKAEIINVKASAGDVKVGEVNDAIIENNFGDVEVNKVSNYLDIDNDCGDIKIKKVFLNRDSYIKSDLGDVKIEETNEIYIDAKVSLGDIKINKNYNKSDITLKIENDCGDIKVSN